MILNLNGPTFFLLFLITVISVIGGGLIRRPSMKRSMQRQQEEWARSGEVTEHYVIDDRASLSANILCFLWCFIGSYITCGVLFGNMLWVLIFFSAIGILH